MQYHACEAGEVILSQADKELLTQESFRTFTNCEVLIMNYLGISNVADGAFSTMERLTHLSIEGDIIDIRLAIFEGLESLYSLSLTNMSISSLPDRVFAHLSGLKELSLKKNALNYVSPNSFYGLSEVILISFTYSNVIITPGLFQHMPNLYQLFMSESPFKYTQGMWDGVALKLLFLENTGLDDLSSDIWTGLEPTLESLFLNRNFFLTIPAHAFHGLSKVSYLELKSCI